MNLVCIVKYVPDVDSFQYDYDNNCLIRENVRLLLNPDDVSAVAFALKVKASLKGTTIHVVTMGPMSVKPHMEDLLRLGVNQASLISDPIFVGSDTYATSQVLARYLQSLDMDCLLTGSHAIDGDTSHVPSQLATYLDLNQMSGVIQIDMDHFTKDSAVFQVGTESAITTYQMDFPGILSVSRESSYTLPYPKRQDLEKDVSDRLHIITNHTLKFEKDVVGLKGSPTKVTAAYNKTFHKKSGQVVRVNEAGIETVYQFLKEKGFL